MVERFDMTMRKSGKQLKAKFQTSSNVQVVHDYAIFALVCVRWDDDYESSMQTWNLCREKVVVKPHV